MPPTLKQVRHNRQERMYCVWILLVVFFILVESSSAHQKQLVFDVQKGPEFYNLEDVFSPLRIFPDDCTLETCFDWTRKACHRHPFPLVYIYPHTNNNWQQLQAQQSEHVAHSAFIYSAFLRAIGNATTTNPEEACVFVAGFDTSSRTGIQFQARDLQQLPYWNRPFPGRENTTSTHLPGENHILFFYEDKSLEDIVQDLEDAQLYSNSSMPMQHQQPDHHVSTLVSVDPEILHSRRFLPGKHTVLGAAMLVSAGSIPSSNLRLGFDLSIPLTPSFPTGLPSFLEFSEKQRAMWMSFRGARYPFVAKVRHFLDALHNPSDNIHILVECTTKAAAYADMLWKYDKDACQAQAQKARSHPFANMTTSEFFLASTFSLVPRGYGLATYRLVEAMAHGSIPIVFGDYASALFAPEYDQTQCTIQFPESMLTTEQGRHLFLEKMRQISPDELQKRRMACWQLFSEWYTIENQDNASSSRIFQSVSLESLLHGIFSRTWQILLQERIGKRKK